MPNNVLGSDLQEIRANAWCGEAAIGAPADDAVLWGVTGHAKQARSAQMLAPPPQDLSNWADPTVGWGVVLPDRDDVAASDKAAGVDAPEAIRTLIAARGNAPVLRYRADLKDGYLRRYAGNGKASDLNFRGLRGTAPEALPWYLLIVGSPADIPWSLQYRIQTEAFVGRLDLDAAGLERYVDALLGDWNGAPRDPKRPVIWAVDHGFPDISRLMRKAIAEPLQARFAGDGEFDKDGFRSDAQATHNELIAALSERKPAFVMTSSHGATFPLADAPAMRAQLGLLVDRQHTTLDPAALLRDWNPDGAIWYAHACCSAGSDAKSKFEGLVGADSSLGRALAGIAQVGACSAPLPQALLGGAHPLGAFIGHVEPTFDWTLRDPLTEQVTTHHIVEALYNRLHLAERPPIGMAMGSYFKAVASLLVEYSDALEAVNAQESDAFKRAGRAKLMAFDRLSMVILGDPTVRVPRAA